MNKKEMKLAAEALDSFQGKLQKLIINESKIWELVDLPRHQSAQVFMWCMVEGAAAAALSVDDLCESSLDDDEHAEHIAKNGSCFDCLNSGIVECINGIADRWMEEAS